MLWVCLMSIEARKQIVEWDGDGRDGDGRDGRMGREKLGKGGGKVGKLDRSHHVATLQYL